MVSSHKVPIGKWRLVAALFPLYFHLINLLSTTIQRACRKLKNKFTEKRIIAAKYLNAPPASKSNKLRTSIEQTSNRNRTKAEQGTGQAGDSRWTAARQALDKDRTRLEKK